MTLVLAYVEPLRDNPLVQLLSKLASHLWMNSFYSIGGFLVSRRSLS